jgi:chromosomal replication initiator protein
MMVPARVQAIILEVALAHRVLPSDIVGQRRLQRMVKPRWEAMARVRALRLADGRPPSYPQIGRWFGDRDHSTVMYGIRRFEEMA